MNDNAAAAGSVRAVLTGLPQRLVLDGLVEESAMLDAIANARERKTHLVSWLVSHEMASARDIAIAAAHEFGVPLLDLDAVDLDLDVVKLVDEKLLPKHRILPLLQRGKRLFLAVCDPTNLQALDEIKFQTTLRIEAIVVEQDKLAARACAAIEAGRHHDVEPGRTTTDFDLENLEVSPATTRWSRRRRAMTSTTRRSSASSTKSWSTRSRKARPTSTSSRTKSTSAFAAQDGVLTRDRPAAGRARDASSPRG